MLHFYTSDTGLFLLSDFLQASNLDDFFVLHPQGVDRWVLWGGFEEVLKEKKGMSSTCSFSDSTFPCSRC